MDPDNRFIHRAMLKVFNVTPKQLKELSAGTFIYAAVFLTEGTGLVTRRHANRHRSRSAGTVIVVVIDDRLAARHKAAAPEETSSAAAEQRGKADVRDLIGNHPGSSGGGIVQEIRKPCR